MLHHDRGGASAAPPPSGGLPLPPPFIAQIQLSSLALYDRHTLLPPMGLLYFFYNPVAYYVPVAGGANTNVPTGTSYQLVDWGTPAQWRVLYAEREDGALSAPTRGERQGIMDIVSGYRRGVR
jgi:hypothetical protein